MVITFEPALRCAQYLARDSHLCGHPANAGFTTPAEGEVLEFLPVCTLHLNELLLSLPVTGSEVAPGHGPN